jgi:hypothetical protein
MTGCASRKIGHDEGFMARSLGSAAGECMTGFADGLDMCGPVSAIRGLGMRIGIIRGTGQ